MNLILALALVLAQPMNLNQQAVMVKDEGVAQGTFRAITINCAGAGVTCTQSGTTMTVTVAGGGGGAPTSATYITQTPDATLSNEQAMSLSGTGIVVNTTGTGVLTIYTGASCTNQFIRALSATGAATCASVNLASDVTGTLPQANGGTGTGALTCAAGERLTSNGTVYSCSTVVTQAYTTVEDEGGALTQRTNLNFTGSGVSCVDSGGKTVCTISGGGAGSANVVEATVDFGATGDTTASVVVTGQAWVTGTSNIVCAPTLLATTDRSEGMEDAVVEEIVVAVHTRVAATGFTITAGSAQGRAIGKYIIHCTGA